MELQVGVLKKEVFMQRYRTILAGLVAGMAAVMVCHAQSVVPDESGLLQLWTTSTNAVDDHAAVTAACREFLAKTPKDDPLVVVVKGIETWRLLKMGNTNEAIKKLESIISVPEGATCLQTAGAEMARGWLTRIDREKVRLALKKIYLRDIEFPMSLEPIKSLKISAMPPFKDRWGTDWSYRLGSSIDGMKSQYYVLESIRLKERSDLEKALALPYAGQIKLEPARMSRVSSGTVEFVTGAGKPAIMQTGGSSDGVTFAYLGAKLIVLADESHWSVVPKPTR